jgi:hypothetical protein
VQDPGPGRLARYRDGSMADPTPTPPDAVPPGGGARRRGPLRAWVWIVLVVVAVGASLGAAWWFERDTSASEAPGQPEAFCNTVGELQSVGDITVDLGSGTDGTAGLRNAAAGLRRLAEAEPPARIRDDLEQLAGALDAVVADAEAMPAGDTTAFARVVSGLDERLGRLQSSSDRVNAYTDRWCGAGINSTPTTG